ncbi:MAG: phage tail protein [Lewinellaceae bacterium]|nr:phage tail protein [Lewinellaceae bacterium]
MLDKITIPEQTILQNPPVAFHFMVVFFAGGVLPNPLDIRFQRVSGLSAEINTETYEEGGQNLYSHRLPGRASYSNLVLERGMAVGSILAAEFNAAMSGFQFYPSNVMVMLLDEDSMPINSWLFLKAYPVRWSVSDLDANSNQIVIETMELAYTHFFNIRI